jgi:hypothetical protein
LGLWNTAQKADWDNRFQGVDVHSAILQWTEFACDGFCLSAFPGSSFVLVHFAALMAVNLPTAMATCAQLEPSEEFPGAFWVGALVDTHARLPNRRVPLKSNLILFLPTNNRNLYVHVRLAHQPVQVVHMSSNARGGVQEIFPRLNARVETIVHGRPNSQWRVLRLIIVQEDADTLNSIIANKTSRSIPNWFIEGVFVLVNARVHVGPQGLCSGHNSQILLE